MKSQSNIPHITAVRGLSDIETRPGDGRSLARLYLSYMQLRRCKKTKEMFCAHLHALDQQIRSAEEDMRQCLTFASDYLPEYKRASRKCGDRKTNVKSMPIDY